MSYHAANRDGASVFETHRVPADRVIAHIREEMSHDRFELFAILFELLDELGRRRWLLRRFRLLQFGHLISEQLRREIVRPETARRLAEWLVEMPCCSPGMCRVQPFSNADRAGNELDDTSLVCKRKYDIRLEPQLPLGCSFVAL